MPKPEPIKATSFEFTIANGAVTAMEAINGSQSQYLRIPTNATFQIGTGTITETITTKNGMETKTFAQSATGSDIYTLTASTLTVASPTLYTPNGGERGLAFTISNGAVTAVHEEVTNGTQTRTHDLSITGADTFTVTSTGVTETRLHGNAVDTITYVQPSGETLYAVASVSTTFVSAGTATTMLSVNDHDRVSVTLSGGSVTAVQAVSATGALTTLTASANIVFSQPEVGFVVETITKGATNRYEVFYDGGGDGVYTEVAHGSGTTVDLVGLKAKLAQLDHSLITLL